MVKRYKLKYLKFRPLLLSFENFKVWRIYYVTVCCLFYLMEFTKSTVVSIRKRKTTEYVYWGPGLNSPRIWSYHDGNLNSYIFILEFANDKQSRVCVSTWSPKPCRPPQWVADPCRRREPPANCEWTATHTPPPAACNNIEDDEYLLYTAQGKRFSNNNQILLIIVNINITQLTSEVLLLLTVNNMC